MKPVWAFLYIFSVLGLFFLVSYFVLPHIQLNQSNSGVSGGLDSLTVSSADSLNSLSDIADTESPASMLPFLSAQSDSLILSEDINVNQDTTALIQYPSGDRRVLFPFFSKLRYCGSNEAPLHVIYYGDSQIEMDRITSTIRKRLQGIFGGSGVGLLALDQIYNPMNQFEVQVSSAWRIADLHTQKLNYHLSSLLFKDAILEDQEGSFRIKQSNLGEHRNNLQLIRIYYTSSDRFDVKAIVRGKTTYYRKMEASNGIKALDFNFDAVPSDVEFYFQVRGVLKVTGISVEAGNGVMVDNVPLRGYSLPPFSKLDPVLFQDMATQVNPALCVLQFGVNLAPYYQRDYLYYQSLLVGEIHSIQQILPNTPILVVGISDLAKKVNGEMVSYPNVETIKKAQFEAAKACNCAFWDLEKFMGGKGSMVKWVNSNPRLGQKDYIHFTADGTEVVGNKITDLLMDEFKGYLESTVTE